MLVDGLLPHSSAPDTSPSGYRADTLHGIDGCARRPADEWLHRSPTMTLRGFDQDR